MTVGAEDYPTIEKRHRYPSQQAARPHNSDEQFAEEWLNFKSYRREIRKRTLRQNPSTMR